MTFVTCGLLLADTARSEIKQQERQEVQTHIQQQKAENKTFRQTLKGMTPEQKEELAKHIEQYQPHILIHTLDKDGIKPLVDFLTQYTF